MTMTNIGCMALACALVLSGCINVTPERAQAMARAIPADYKQQIVIKMHSFLKDPYSVRDAEITMPTVIMATLTPDIPGVCVRLNAKNAFGAYTGQETYRVAFQGGQITSVMPEQWKCTEAWKPFPELNGQG